MFGKKPILPDEHHIKALPISTDKASHQLDARDVARADKRWDDNFREIKRRAHERLIDILDPATVLRMDLAAGRNHIAKLLNEIVISEKLRVSANEEVRLLNEIADDLLGFGPLERFLTRDDVSDIMVNGTEPIYVESNGIVHRASVSFDDPSQLLNVCQRIVSLVGRRVDESSPICDARLKDGSRVNVIVPPIAINGPILTIRRFKSERPTMDTLVRGGSISQAGSELLRIIAHVRCNLLIVGGTGSGKTTLLNVMTGYIEDKARIITCEDTAELQLQQPHVVSLETRPPNTEGRGEVTMRDLVRNCLRMRPDRIIVGEVRGAEAFDLLQAMNTGHDGSMGTVHANSPAEAVMRVTSLVTMGYPSLQPEVIEQMFGSSVDVMIQVDRLRDGSRKITRITEVTRDAEGAPVLNDLMVLRIGQSQANEASSLTADFDFVGRPAGQLLRRAAYFDQTSKLEALFKNQELDQSGA